MVSAAIEYFTDGHMQREAVTTSEETI